MVTLPSLGPAFDPATIRLIELVTIAHGHDYWPEEVVSRARAELCARYGRVPRLEDLCAYYDPNTVFGHAKAVLDARSSELSELAERMGHHSPCHSCRAPRYDSDPTYMFGLARILEHKRTWGAALAVLALNVVTVPLGVAVGAGPGSTTRARIARCRVVMCEPCAARRRGVFGGIQLSEHDCARHPSWARLHGEGFTTFLTTEELAGYQ